MPLRKGVILARKSLCRNTQVEEQPCHQQDYYCHGHNAPHEGQVGLACLSSHIYIIICVVMYVPYYSAGFSMA